MITALEKDHILVIRLQDGDDFFSSVKEAVEKYEIKSGIIINCIGMMRDTVIAYLKEPGKYQEMALAGPLELLSLQGNIAFHKEEMIIHAHCTLGNERGEVFGGHLRKATVHVTNELFIALLTEVELKREFEAATGLAGLFPAEKRTY